MRTTTFEQAFLDAVLAEYADIPSNEAEIDFELSSAFIHQVDRLTRNTQKKTWHFVNTVLKRALLVAVITALLATTALAVSPVREKLLKFFVHNEGEYYSFSFDPEQAETAPECIKTAYFPTYIPDNYHFVSGLACVAGVGAIYENAEEQIIFYTQDVIPHDPEHNTLDSFNSEGVTIRRIFIDDYEIVRGEDAETIYYAWTNHEYLFTLICDKVIAEEEIVKVFKSVQVDPNAVIDGAE